MANNHINAPLLEPGARQQPKPFSIAMRGDVVEQGDPLVLVGPGLPVWRQHVDCLDRAGKRPRD
jgi:hypothetical protein